MKKVLKVVGGIVLGVVLYGFANGLLAGLSSYEDEDALLSGSMREYFIGEITKECTTGFTTSTGFSAETIKSYCTCSATGLANITTLREAKAYSNSASTKASMRANTERIANECSKITLEM